MSKLNAKILERLNYWSKRSREAGVKLRPKDIRRVVRAQCSSVSEMLEAYFHKYSIDDKGQAQSVNLLAEELVKKSTLLDRIPKFSGYIGAPILLPFSK